MKAFWTLGVASMVLCATGAFAQVKVEIGGQQPPVTREAPASSQATRGDQEIFACKLAESRNEIELAKLAQQKSQNEQVKQFAAKMIKDHETAAAKIEKLAGEWGRATGRTESTREPAAETPRSDAAPQRPGVAVGVGGAARPAGALNWVSIHQQIADKCLASAKKELGQKEGAEFDKCYMGMQVGAHMKMIDADEVFANYVSADNREAIDECLKMATEHLREAKQIAEGLEGKATARSASRAE